MVTYYFNGFNSFSPKKRQGAVWCNNDETAPIFSSRPALSSTLKEGVRMSYNRMNISTTRKIQIPFSSFSILEFVRYSRALVDKTNLSALEVEKRIKAVGLNKKVKLRLKKLSPIEYRALSIATKFNDETHSIYLNFENLKFSKKNLKLLNDYIKIWSSRYSVYIFLNDIRFMPKAMLEKQQKVFDL